MDMGGFPLDGMCLITGQETQAHRKPSPITAMHRHLE